MPSLLDYLVQPNPELDRAGRLQSLNTIDAKYRDIEGTRQWLEFSCGTVLPCMGDILNEAYPQGALHVPAPIQSHLRTIDEASLDGFSSDVEPYHCQS